MFGFSLGGGLANRFVAWWGGWRLALDFTGGQYHPKGEAGLVLRETRASSAMVLQGDGTYVERATDELAIGQAVGGQFSQAVINQLYNGRPTDAVNANPTPPAVSAGISPVVGTVGGFTWAVGTNTDKWQTNSTITPIDGISSFSFVATAHGDGAQISGTVGLTSVESKTFVYDMDSKAVVSGDAPDVIIDQGGRSQRLVFYITNDGTATATVGLFRPFADATKDQISIDLQQWTDGRFVPPLIPTTNGPVTRAADNPAVVQGLGDELLADGAAPQDWSSTGATITDNIDGTINVASTGNTWNRAYTNYIGWTAGVKLYGIAKTRVGTSLSAKLTLRDSTAIAESHLKLTVGAVGVTNEGAGTIEIISQNVDDDGEHTVEFYFTPNSTTETASVGIGPDTAVSGNTVVAVSASLQQVLPYPGYSAEGALSGRGLVTNGVSGFTSTEGWHIQPSATASVVGNKLRIAMTGPSGRASYPITTTPGRVYRGVLGIGAGTITDASYPIFACVATDEYLYPDPIVDQSYTVPSSPITWEGNFMATEAEMHMGVVAIIAADGEYAEILEADAREVEPGVVIEAVGVWGDTDGQHVLRLDDGTSNNIVLLRRTSSGTIKLFIVGGGATLYDAASTTAWPDGIEAIFRVEITDTEGGCFFAVFLDDVYLADLLPGALDYPSAIDQLNLAVVSGVKTIKSLKVR